MMTRARADVETALLARKSMYGRSGFDLVVEENPSIRGIKAPTGDCGWHGICAYRKAIRIFVTIPRGEFLTHGVAVYTARSSDLIFVCLRCAYVTLATRPRCVVFALRPFPAGASVISLKITSFSGSGSVARLPYLPSSCLISRYRVPLPPPPAVSRR